MAGAAPHCTASLFTGQEAAAGLAAPVILTRQRPKRHSGIPAPTRMGWGNPVTSAGAQVTGLLTLPWFAASFATEEMLTFSERRGTVACGSLPVQLPVPRPNVCVRPPVLFCGSGRHCHLLPGPSAAPGRDCAAPRMVLGSGRFLTWWMTKRSRCERPGRGERLATGRDKPFSFILGGGGSQINALGLHPPQSSPGTTHAKERPDGGWEDSGPSHPLPYPPLPKR